MEMEVEVVGMAAMVEKVRVLRAEAAELERVAAFKRADADAFEQKASYLFHEEVR